MLLSGLIALGLATLLAILLINSGLPRRRAKARRLRHCVAESPDSVYREVLWHDFP
jgi:hypothetical protein